MTAASDPAPGALAAALGGMAALAGAMGIGRFLLTPALPMMAEGTGLSPAAAGLVASANFAGYLAGALALGFVTLPRPRRLVLAALALSALTTALMAAVSDPLAWALLRALGGAASAAVLVGGSALVMGALGRAGRPGLGAVHFGGVGAGIALSAGLAAPALVADDGWAPLWAMGGAASLALLAVAARLLPREAPGPAPGAAPLAPGEPLSRLAFAYGCVGFGYVVLATFLVAMLREGESGRTAETLAWAAVGLAALPSIALWSWAGRRLGAVTAFRLAMLIEAAGVALGALLGGAVALVVAAIALGGTFMGLTALGLLEAARRAGPASGRALGIMTASFGLGQILGPAFAGWAREATGGYALPGLVAAAVLVAGALVAGPGRR